MVFLSVYLDIILLMTKEEFYTKYASQLNKEQLQAVQSVDGPVLLLAVPGSGKTTVLVTRLGYMILCEDIDPRNILVLTYTVAATHDMGARFTSIFGEEASQNLEFRTINGICAKVITKYASMLGKSSVFELITDEKVTTKILGDILKDVMDDFPTESDIKAARTLITYAKNMMLSDEDIEDLGNEANISLSTIYKKYNAYLKQNGLMDYDDQMVYAYKMLSSSEELLKYYQDQYRYICVDEAQDTSKIQHEIIKLLAGGSENLFMVGDEDQSIYGFRAAYPEALLNFEKDHPSAKVLVMDINYRSNAKIVEAADIFIQHNKSRHKKHMQPTKSAGSDINFIEAKSRGGQNGYLLKVAKNCTRETAVLYRDNESALPLIDMLERNDISYRLKNSDMTFFTSRVVTDITNIMKFAISPDNTDLFMRIYFKLQMFLSKKEAIRLCEESQDRIEDVLDCIDYIDVRNGMIKGKCYSIRTHLNNMLKETPYKAINRICNFMGYGEFLERNGINEENKLFILRTLAGNEQTIEGFLSRLRRLQKIIKEKKPDYNSTFILSTIHSAKGLEWDRVYLMDVADGIFPSRVPERNTKDRSEIKYIEEERRLFYVAITRAKNDLNIFEIEGQPSTFIKEMNLSLGDEIKKNTEAFVKAATTAILNSSKKKDVIVPVDIASGERVVQKSYGAGVITNVSYKPNGSIKNFRVFFDNGRVGEYAFPMAFEKGLMTLESGVKTPKTQKSEFYVPDDFYFEKPEPKSVVKKAEKKTSQITKRRTGDTNKYSYWVENYPDYVVIKKEGFYWTTRDESAEVLHDQLGYKIGESFGHAVTGSPKLEAITDALKRARIQYIAIEDGEIVDQYEE